MTEAKRIECADGRGGIFRKLRRPKHYSGRMWTTADGTKMPVEEMTDSHLDNAIAHCKRAAERYAKSLSPAARDYLLSEILCIEFSHYPQGEMAQLAFESGIANLEWWECHEEDDVEELERRILCDNMSYQHLIAERARRQNLRNTRKRST